MGPQTSPRVRKVGEAPKNRELLMLTYTFKVFPIMIRKIHEFLIEADISMEEWMAACNLMVAAGKVSSDARNEVVLVTDVFGIESLCGNNKLRLYDYRTPLIPIVSRHSGSDSCRTYVCWRRRHLAREQHDFVCNTGSFLSRWSTRSTEWYYDCSTG